MSCLSERTLRRKAYRAGYQLSKGFVHHSDGPIFRNREGKRETGYTVMDLREGTYVQGCFNAALSNLWTLDDVSNFLESAYKTQNLTW